LGELRVGWRAPAQEAGKPNADPERELALTTAIGLIMRFLLAFSTEVVENSKGVDKALVRPVEERRLRAA